jgi:hypothetical protein
MPFSAVVSLLVSARLVLNQTPLALVLGQLNVAQRLLIAKMSDNGGDSLIKNTIALANAQLKAQAKKTRKQGGAS